MSGKYKLIGKKRYGVYVSEQKLKPVVSGESEAHSPKVVKLNLILS